MTKLRLMMCLLVTIAMLAGSAFALTIRVAPQAIVLSSSGGRLTVHTDVPYRDVGEVHLTVNECPIEVGTFADSLGNLVVQCDKDVVGDAVGEFSGKWTTADVTLSVDGDSASEAIAVKK